MSDSDNSSIRVVVFVVRGDPKNSSLAFILCSDYTSLQGFLRHYISV